MLISLVLATALSAPCQKPVCTAERVFADMHNAAISMFGWMLCNTTDKPIKNLEIKTDHGTIMVIFPRPTDEQEREIAKRCARVAGKEYSL